MSKGEYYQQELNKYKNDVRKTWIIYRKLIGKLQDKTAVTDHFFFLYINGEHTSDSKIISEGFNDSFVNAGLSHASYERTVYGIFERQYKYNEYFLKSNNSL